MVSNRADYEKSKVASLFFKQKNDALCAVFENSLFNRKKTFEVPRYHMQPTPI